MKTTILLCSLTLGVNVLSAQKLKSADVPQPVIEAFNSNFNGSVAKSWEKEKGMYEAEFVVNKIEHSATFSPEGALMETEAAITLAELPASVNVYVQKNHPGYNISEASRIVAPSGAYTFEAEIRNGKKQMELLFDSNGNFLSAGSALSEKN